VRRDILSNQKKIIALMLVCSMIMSTNAFAETISENALPADGVEAAEEADERTGEESECVQFTDEGFIDMLASNYGGEIPAFADAAKRNEDGSKPAGYGRVKKSDVEKITTLKLLIWGVYGIDYSEIGKLTALRHLYLKGSYRHGGYIDISNILFPESLREIKLDYCMSDTELDLSACTNLKTLELYRLQLPEDNRGIKGINSESSTLGDLRRAIFDRSNIGEIIFPGTVSRATPNLSFSANYCTSLKKFSSGGYRLIGDDKNCIPLKGCTSLETLNVKALANTSEQTFDLSGCKSLYDIDITYFFLSDSDVVTINTKGVSLPYVGAEDGPNETRFVVKVSEDSAAKGKFNLLGDAGSYIQEITMNAEEYIDFFESEPSFGESADTNSVAFVVFGQDRVKFEDNELWKSDKSTYRRNYTANQIYLHIGEYINDNDVYFYTAEGVPVDLKSNEYTVDIQTFSVPETYASDPDYIVLSPGTPIKTKVRAENVGVATITVTVSNGSSASECQYVNVYPNVTSLTLSEHEYGNVLTPGVYRFEYNASVDEKLDTTVNLADSSSGAPESVPVAKMIEGDIRSWIYRKDTNGEYKPYTNSALTAYGDTSVADVSGRTKKMPLYIDYKGSEGYNLPSGEYRVQMRFMNNFKDRDATELEDRYYLINYDFFAIDQDHVHRFDSGTETVAATATETGTIVYRCLDCPYSYSEVIPALSDAGDIVPEDSDIITASGNEVTPTTISVRGVKGATYTGKAITFDLRVYAGKTLLKNGTDYTVRYVNNKNVPKADVADSDKPAVIITGKGKYADKQKYDFKPVYFDINPVDLSILNEAGKVVVSDAVVTSALSSKLVRPVPTISIDGKALNKSDYSVSYGEGKENGIDVSIVAKNTITLTGRGNYAGELTSIYEVVDKDAKPINLSKAKVKGLKKKIQYHDGEDVVQSDYSVSVKINKKSVPLTENTDYTVKYVNNIDVGTASMIITAVPGNENNLVGAKVISFRVTGTAMKKLSYTFPKRVDYTGATIKPGMGDLQPELKLHDRTLDKDLVINKDYEVSYLKNIQAGKATMVITGKGLYTGTVRKTFRISAIDLGKNEKIAASIVPGSVKKETEGKLKGKYTVEVSVTYAGRVLVEGRDYTVTYKNNSGPGSATAGTKAPQVIIKGKGNYAKTRIVPFDIAGE